jgi:hypothetical protein
VTLVSPAFADRSASYACTTYWLDSSWEASSRGTLEYLAGGGNPGKGRTETFGTSRGWNCTLTGENIVVEATNWQFNWVNSQWNWCAAQWSGQSAWGYTYATTTCSFTFHHVTWNASRVWITGTPHDSGVFTLGIDW